MYSKQTLANNINSTLTAVSSDSTNFKQLQSSEDKNLNNLNRLNKNSTSPFGRNDDVDLSNGNGPWMKGSLSMSLSKTPEDSSSAPTNITNNPSADSSPSPDILNPTPLAFNGNTYVRPNKKERKGLYFLSSTSDSQSQSASSTPEIQGPTSGLGSQPGEKKTSLATTKTDVMDEDSTTSCGNINKTVIPSLKFSSPRTSTSASASTDEDTLDSQESSQKQDVGDQKLISYHEMTNPDMKNRNGASNNTRGSNHLSSSSSPPSKGTAGAVGVGDLLGISSLSTTTAPHTATKHDGSSGGGVGLNNNFNSHTHGGHHHHQHQHHQNNHSQPQHDHSHSLSNTSTEENFECFGEGSESFSILDSTNTPESNSLQNFRDLNESDILSSPGGDGNPPASLSRQGWQRTSLRRTPNPNNSSLNGDGMNHRRWGSFRSSSKRGAPVVPSSKALANELYRSSSYHSSGRSSAGDGEEMYSDSSLEGEVIDLTKKVHHLEEKFTVLAENQNDVDDRYTRSKQENAELSTKLFMFEEQLREVELRADEKLRDEQRRHKEALSRFEREKQLQIENYEIKSQMLEKDLSSAKVEVKRIEGTLERERNEKNRLADKYANVEREISSVREQNRELLNQNRIDRETMAMESAGSQQALVELKKQLEGLSHFHLNSSSHSFRRNDSTESEASELKSRLREADEEIRRIKQQNKQLQETNEELSAQILNQGLENGRILLKELNTSGDPGGNSLAAEFEAMSMEEMKSALKDQKEANQALRSYIDGILLNIVEHYPQLLEVKNKNRSGSNGMIMASESK